MHAPEPCVRERIARVGHRCEVAGRMVAESCVERPSRIGTDFDWTCVLSLKT